MQAIGGCGGGRGIRTHDALLHTGFQDQLHRPLGQPSFVTSQRKAQKKQPGKSTGQLILGFQSILGISWKPWISRNASLREFGQGNRNPVICDVGGNFIGIGLYVVGGVAHGNSSPELGCPLEHFHVVIAVTNGGYSTQGHA